jgi:hypothetical protein
MKARARDQPVLGFVTYGKVKLANLRARPPLAVTVGAWDDYDRVMAGQRRVVALFEPARIYGNQPHDVAERVLGSYIST